MGLKPCGCCGGSFSDWLNCCPVCRWPENPAEIPPPLPGFLSRPNNPPAIPHDEPPPVPASRLPNDRCDAKPEDAPDDFLDVPAFGGEYVRGHLKPEEDVSSRPVLARMFGMASSMALADLGYGATPAGANRACSLLKKINDILGILDPHRHEALHVRIRQRLQGIEVAGSPAETSNIRARLCELTAPTKEASRAGDPWTIIDPSSVAVLIDATEKHFAGLKAKADRQPEAEARQTLQLTRKFRRIRDMIACGEILGLTGQHVADCVAAVLLRRKVGWDVRRRILAEGFSGKLFESFEAVARRETITIQGRTFTIRDYADTVARSMAHQAVNVSTICRLKKNGINHVCISSHPQSVIEICTPYAGQVFYIGPLKEDPDGFPRLYDTPFGNKYLHPHPKCRHSMAGYPIDMRRITDPEDIKRKKELSDKIPERFFGKTDAEIRSMIAEMSPAEIEAAFPGSQVNTAAPPIPTKSPSVKAPRRNTPRN